MKLKCEVCGKLCNELVGLASHISQSKNHPKWGEYSKIYNIDKYINKKMIDIFLNSYIVNFETGCWEWTGQKDKDDYGLIYAYNTLKKAHRFSYEQFKGDIGNLCVCHECDNPCCVNPDHLWLGTISDNTRDCIEKGRRDHMKGHLNPSKRDNVKRKISKKMKGRILSTEHKLKISNSKKGTIPWNKGLKMESVGG